MSDEKALLAAIAAHPDEDTPRLVYADWLDEHNLAIRAEFIRLQVEIARKQATLPRVLLNRHVDLFKRNQELLDHHRDELLGPLANLPPGTKIEFDRGFVSELTLTCDQFHALGNAIATTHPLPRVAVVDVVLAIRRFFGGRHDPDTPQAVVTAIRTRESKAGDDDALELDMLTVAPKGWPRLEELDISGCRFNGFLFMYFTEPEWFPVLTNLDASVNELTDTAVLLLLGTQLPRQLRRLILGGNPLSDESALALAEQWPTGADDKLEHLNLRFTNIGVAGRGAVLRRFGGRVDLF